MNLEKSAFSAESFESIVGGSDRSEKPMDVSTWLMLDLLVKYKPNPREMYYRTRRLKVASIIGPV